MTSRSPRSPLAILAPVLVAFANTFSPRTADQDAEVADRVVAFSIDASKAWDDADQTGAGAPEFEFYVASLLSMITTHGPTHANDKIIARAMSLAKATAASLDAVAEQIATAAPTPAQATPEVQTPAQPGVTVSLGDAPMGASKGSAFAHGNG